MLSPASRSPDLALLRAKLVSECECVCPRAVVWEVRRTRPGVGQELWGLDEDDDEDGEEEMREGDRGGGKGRWREVGLRGRGLVDLAGNEGYGSGVWRVVGERRRMVDENWGFRGVTGHGIMDASNRDDIGEGGYGLEPRFKMTQVADGNYNRNVWQKTRVPGGREQFVVMDCRTWELKKVGTRFEAEALANNPGIDAGNGVWLFRKDHLFATTLASRRRHASLGFVVFGHNSSRSWYIRPLLRSAKNMAEVTENCDILC